MLHRNRDAAAPRRDLKMCNDLFVEMRAHGWGFYYNYVLVSIKKSVFFGSGDLGAQKLAPGPNLPIIKETQIADLDFRIALSCELDGTRSKARYRRKHLLQTSRSPYFSQRLTEIPCEANCVATCGLIDTRTQAGSDGAKLRGV